METGSPRLALAAVAVSALVGVLAMIGSIVSADMTTDANREDQRERLQEERQRSDISELRSVVDHAAVRLGQAQLHAIKATAYWEVDAEDDLEAVGKKLDKDVERGFESFERLNVRLGESSPVAQRYGETVNTLVDIRSAALDTLTDDRKRKMDELVESMQKSRAAFLKEARKLVGSEVS